MFAGRAAASDSQLLPSGAAVIQTTFKYIYTHTHNYNIITLLKSIGFVFPCIDYLAACLFYLKPPVFDAIPWKDYILDISSTQKYAASVVCADRVWEMKVEHQRAAFEL